ncbi:MAG: SDR family NAD(P)-dependent oxidoreductase [Clostridia bacterium]|nr:SDR family NAD(P)-dependent oxidoreductase [Clostridia bacterium]
MKETVFDKDSIMIVTGASSGMGREFALRLSKEFGCREMWLIARNKDKLEELAASLPVPARVIPLDLGKSSSFEELADLIEKEDPKISVLVNAAGYGKFGEFSKMDLDSQTGIIRLNDEALVKMCHLVRDRLSPGSAVINLGSLSAFQPVPYINVYGASKAFVLSFSRALNVEWKKRGVFVMAVCPGWVKTDFFKRAVSDDTISYYNRFFTPEQVIDRAVKDLKRKKDVSVCGFTVRAQVLLTKLLPHTLVMKIWCRQQKK